MVIIKISDFANFGQVMIKISHFAEFEQVIIKVRHFDDYQQNSLGRNRMPRHFYFWGNYPVSSALHPGFSDLWRPPPALRSIPTLGFFFECLGIRFFNSSHVTYMTPCRARGHSHSLKEAKDFPRGEKYFRHMPLLTYLIYFSTKGLY